MKRSEFQKLERMQQLAMLVALYVRNGLEDFHVEHLDDSRMKQLNQIMRQAIYDALVEFSPKRNPDLDASIIWHVNHLPDYWEPPHTNRSDAVSS